ncbi:MAG TPA: DUF6596 domain-containing protein, partial [Fimbriimonadaceae bacterium]|nr:DUF6596 domain-containing protein [Fimbriimonadaceae bacterium]
MLNPVETRLLVEETYANESRRVFASLVKALRDFDLAEDALHEAFRSAIERWPAAGVPDNPAAWLVATGKFKGIDVLRRRARLEPLTAIDEELLSAPEVERIGEPVEDERLRLIFTCCHPSISPDAQVALTLREVCGLTTEEIAHAFLTPAPTLAQRIVRAKTKIRDANIPFELPGAEELSERLRSVLRIVYLVFNEGYSASSGDSLTRADLSTEAIRLGRLLCDLLPDAEVLGLLALMLLQESRRSARSTESGDLVLLEDQDRSLWNRSMITEGTTLIERAFASGQVGVYAIQAAIAAIHANASEAGSTDWNEIVALYDTLLEANSSPIVQLNRA